MKKFLLFVVAAVFAANMNAQTLPAKKVAKSAEVSLSKFNATVNKNFVAAKPAAKAEALNADVKAPSMKFAAKAPKKAAASANDLAGTYCYDFVDPEYEVGHGLIAECEKFSDANGEGVILNGNFGGYNSNGAFAYYDAATNSLIVPPGQPIVELSDNDGNPFDGIILAAVATEEYKFDFDTYEEDGEEYYSPLVFNIEEREDGGITLSLQNDGWIIMVVDKEDNMMGYFDYSYDSEALNTTNAKASYLKCEPTKDGWTEWEEFEDNVYVENYGSFATIHGLLGLFNLDVDLDDEAGTVTLANMQKIHEGEINTQTEGTIVVPYYWYIIDNDVITDPSASVTGIYSAENGYMGFGTPLNEKEFKPFLFALCSTWQPGKGAYWIGELAALEVLANEDSESGIKTVGVTSNNNMIYNIAGQRVSDSYKGVAIKNGKKFIK